MTRLAKTLTIFTSILVLFIVSVYATHELFTVRIQGGNDFYPRWRGSQLFWQDGINPYSEAASETIQRGIRGRLSRPDEDQLLFVYPFYTSFLLIPLIWLPYSWAQAVWMVTLQFSLIAAVILCLYLLEWRLPVWLLALTLIWGILFYNSARTIILGQFAGLIFLWLMGSLLALKRRHDSLAGLLLALTTIKPQMVIFLIPALLIWAVTQRRWQFVTTFAAALALLIAASFLLLPGWFIDFTRQVMAYSSYTTYASSPVIWLTEVGLPWLGPAGALIVRLFWLGLMLWSWRNLPQITTVSTELFMVLGFTMVATSLVFNSTATTNQTVLYLPLFLALQAASRTWRWGPALVALLFLATLIGGWVLFLTTIRGNLEHPIMYWPLPALVTLLLLVGWPFFRKHTEGADRCVSVKEAV